MAALNLLTANQSSWETNTTGATTVGSHVYQDTTEAWTGAASLKTVTDGTGEYQGVEIECPVASFIASEQITLSSYFLTDATSAGKVVRFYCQSDTGSIGSVGNITLPSAGVWTRFSVTVTLGATLPASWIGIRWDTGGAYQALNVWMDGCQIEAGTLGTWYLGGWVSAADTLASIGGMTVAGTVGVVGAATLGGVSGMTVTPADAVVATLGGTSGMTVTPADAGITTFASLGGMTITPAPINAATVTASDGASGIVAATDSAVGLVSATVSAVGIVTASDARG